MHQKLKNTFLNFYWKLRYRNDYNNSPIFIVGTGRSGTHFLARTMQTHPQLTDLTGGEENHFVFNDVVKLAQNDKHADKDFQKLVEKYNILSRVSGKNFLLDQSHPNLWLMEKLLCHFPEGKFVAIIRDPASVAYSTTMHNGVKKWLETYSKLPNAINFLGIDYLEKRLYKDLSLVEKSTLRWKSHVLEIDRLLKKYPNNFTVVCYEELCTDSANVISNLSTFLNLKNEFELPYVELKSLEKKFELSEFDLNQIAGEVCKLLDNNELTNDVKACLLRYMELKNV